MAASIAAQQHDVVELADVGPELLEGGGDALVGVEDFDGGGLLLIVFCGSIISDSGSRVR
jgi:hypothetical protein